MRRTIYTVGSLFFAFLIINSTAAPKPVSIKIGGAEPIETSKAISPVSGFEQAVQFFSPGVLINNGLPRIFSPTAASLNKSFSPIQINPGGVSTLTISLFNANGFPLTNTSAPDTLPIGMTIAGTPNVTNTCGGVVSATAGTGTFGLTGGTVPAKVGAIDGTCTFSVDVTTTVQGNSVNTIPASALTNNESQTNTNPASATLQVNSMNAPSVSQTLTPNTIKSGETTTLVITIRNNDLSIDLTNLGITNTFPVQLTTVGSASTTCTGGTATAGGTQVTLSGASLIKNSTCTVTVGLTSTTVGGPYTNTVAIGAITSNQGVTNASTATAQVTVQTANIVVGTTFTPAGSPYVGDTKTLNVTLQNPTTQLSYTNAAISDTLPAGLTFAGSPTSSCGGTPTASGQILSLSGGTIAAGATCTISVLVTSNSAATYTNSISANAATATQASSSNSTSANITFQALTITVGTNFSASPQYVGETTNLRITLANPTTSTTYTNLGITDTIPAGVTANGTATSSCGGSIGTSGQSITFSGGTIAAGATCTLTVPVTSATPGTYSHSIVINSATATQTSLSNATSANITFNALDITGTKAFSPSSINVGGSTTLTITLTNPSSTVNYTALGFTDNFPSGMSITAGPATTCTGGSIAASTATKIVLSGASLSAGASCNVTATVTSSIGGSLTNTLSSGTITATGGSASASNGSSIGGSVSVNAITGTKSFSPSSVAVGGTSTMTIALTNSSGVILNNAAFTDTFPSNLAVAATPAVSTSAGCGAGTVIKSPGPGALTGGETAFQFTGGTIGVGATCTITMSVTPATTGNKNNTIAASAVTTTEGFTNGSSIAGTLSVGASALTISQTFQTNPITVGQATRLRFTVSNPSSSGNVTGLGFTNTMPVGMVVAPSPANPNPATSCTSGSVSAVAGTNTIALSGGSLNQGSNCTVTVYVTATTPPASGSYTNTVPINAITTTQSRTNSAAGSATLNVVGVTLANAFFPTTIAPGGRSVLTVTVTNYAPFPLTNVTAVNPLPQSPAAQAIKVAPLPHNGSTTCGSGTVNGTAGAASYSLTGGTVPAAVGGVVGLCTFQIEVTSSGSTSSNTNTLPSGAANFSNNEGITTQSSTAATLSFSALLLSVNKSFAPLIVSGGTTSVVTIQITNPSAQNYIGVGFTDHMPTGMTVANPANATTTCTSGTVSATPGGATFGLTGGQIAASSNCAVNVSVTSSIAGNLTNTINIGEVTSFQGASNTQAAEASLTNLPGIGISKAFSPAAVSVGGTSRLIITVNNAEGSSASGIAFTDSLPNGLTIANTPNEATTCSSGMVTSTSSSVSLSGGSLLPNSSCTVAIDVAVSSLGTYVNTIPSSAVTTNEGGTNATPATASVTAAVLPTVAIAFNPSSIAVGDTSELTLSLGNTSGSALTLASSMTNTFPASLRVSATPNIGGTCTNAAISATAGGNSVSYAAGSTVPNGGCTIAVDVTSAVPGTYNNSVGVGGLSTNGGGNENPAFGTLTVGTTAGDLSISGRVVDRFGTPVVNAILVLSDQDGLTRYARTSPFGYYQFTNVESGSTYVLAVIEKQRIYAPKILILSTDLEEIDFFEQ